MSDPQKARLPGRPHKTGDGVTLDTGRWWMCGHSHRSGVKRNMGSGMVMWRCANCAEQSASEKAAELLRMTGAAV